jgi:hypothetical protein
LDGKPLIGSFLKSTLVGGGPVNAAASWKTEPQGNLSCHCRIVGNNGTGFLHTKTKLARSHARNPRWIADTIREAKPLELVTENGMAFPGFGRKPRYATSLSFIRGGYTGLRTRG